VVTRVGEKKNNSRGLAVLKKEKRGMVGLGTKAGASLPVCSKRSDCGKEIGGCPNPSLLTVDWVD